LVSAQDRDARSGLKKSAERLDAIAIGLRPVKRRGRNPAAAIPPDPLESSVTRSSLFPSRSFISRV
jgi:hypothetical protein